MFARPLPRRRIFVAANVVAACGRSRSPTSAGRDHLTALTRSERASITDSPKRLRSAVRKDRVLVVAILLGHSMNVGL